MEFSMKAEEVILPLSLSLLHPVLNPNPYTISLLLALHIPFISSSPLFWGLPNSQDNSSPLLPPQYLMLPVGLRSPTTLAWHSGSWMTWPHTTVLASFFIVILSSQAPAMMLSSACPHRPMRVPSSLLLSWPFHVDCSSPLSNHQNLPSPSSGFELHSKSVKVFLISTCALSESVWHDGLSQLFSPLSGCGFPEDSDDIRTIFVSSQDNTVHASKMKTIAGKGPPPMGCYRDILSMYIPHTKAEWCHCYEIQGKWINLSVPASSLGKWG